MQFTTTCGRYVIRGLKSCPRIDEHNAHLCVSLAVASLLLVIAFTVNSVIGSDNGKGVEKSAKDVFDVFYIACTPSTWAFSIIIVIYVWQAAWIVYAWTIIFRPSAPHTIHWVVNVLFSIANVADIIQVFLWGSLRPHLAAVFTFILASCLIACVGKECVYLHRHATSMDPSKTDLWLTRILVLNGLVVYATWQSVFLLNNIGIVLRYYAGVPDVLTVTLVLSFLTANILIYFILENTILDRYTRNLYFVYPVILWALSGSLDAQSGVENQKKNYIFTFVLLITTVFLFIIRIVLLIIVNHFSQSSPFEMIISLFISPQTEDDSTTYNETTTNDEHTLHSQ